MRTFHVEKEMAPYLDKVLMRDNIKVMGKKETGDGYDYTLPISGNRFHEAKKDSYCERESEQNHGIPVYSLKTLQNPGKLRRLMRLNGNRYLVLSTDEEKYSKILDMM